MCIIFTSTDSHNIKFVRYMSSSFTLVLQIESFTCLVPNGSLVIAIKPKDKYRFHMAAMLFYKTSGPNISDKWH
jgi:hypothetical protein